MGAPAKFLFDTDFSNPSARVDTINAAESARQITEAEARGNRSGYAAGQADAQAETVRRGSMALEDIARAIEQVAGRLTQTEKLIEDQAIEIALAAARKLCQELINREPLAEMMTLIADCLRHQLRTPHLVIRINDGLYDDARARIETLAKQSGFEGRLVILADPEIVSGDCMIEWADGGVITDRAATDTKITELVGRYMASRKPAEGLR
jgi:flagellar assembly protein FliH